MERKTEMKKRISILEETILNRIRWAGIKLPEREYRFHPKRLWRFDFAWPESRIAVEAEGGIFVSGRHNRPSGMANDCEKYNAAALLGWKVLRYTKLNLDGLLDDLKAAGL